MASLLKKCSDCMGVSLWLGPSFHLAIEVSHGPRARTPIRRMTGDEMEMQVLSPFTKGDGVDAITSTHPFHQ